MVRFSFSMTQCIGEEMVMMVSAILSDHATCRSRDLDDGSPTKGMESAASYSGSTNPGGTFK